MAVVDDHPLFRHGLAVALRREPDLEVVGEVGSSRDALELAKDVAFDVAMVDVLMPGVSGITLAAELSDVQPECRTIGLSVIDEPGLIADMLRAGARGYALKTQDTTEIVGAIRQVLGGLRYLPPSVSHDAVDEALTGGGVRPLERLTHRERQIFELLIRGHSNDEIAVHCGISRRTVETHRQRITKKLSAHSLAELQRVAARYGGLVV